MLVLFSNTNMVYYVKCTGRFDDILLLIIPNLLSTIKQLFSNKFKLNFQSCHELC